jgi:ATP adenylyltransferase
MESANLWAPWRMQYLRGLPGGDGGPEGCFLCEAWRRSDSDESMLVLHRGPTAMILMNRFPYTTGHLMVVPSQHVGDLTDMMASDRAAMMEMTVVGERLIQATLNPQGMNIGTNLGRVAGAGLPGHVHMHLVPRWGGDTNFINVVGQVRVIPQALEQTYAELKAALPKVLHE